MQPNVSTYVYLSTCIDVCMYADRSVCAKEVAAYVNWKRNTPLHDANVWDALHPDVKARWVPDSLPSDWPQIMPTWLKDLQLDIYIYIYIYTCIDMCLCCIYVCMCIYAFSIMPTWLKD